MKKLLMMVGILAIGIGSALAQGTVDFKNLGNGLSQPVFNVNGTTPLDAGFTIELLGGTTNQPSLSPIATATIANGFFFGGTQSIPTVAGGSVASIIIRAWKTSDGSFANATIRGESTRFSVITGGFGAPPTTTLPATFTAANDPISMTGFTSFAVMVVAVPEPSIFALGALGLMGLMCLRSKKD